MNECNQSVVLRYHSNGFTLVEILLVLVLMGMMTAFVVMNVEGIEYRKALQARESMQLDLEQIAYISQQQGRVLGLKVLPINSDGQISYQVVEYKAAKHRVTPVDYGITVNGSKLDGSLSTDQQQSVQWSDVPDFTVQTLPYQVTITIQPDATAMKMFAQRNQAALPQLVWLGNGDAVAAHIQLLWQQRPLGEPLYLNSSGQVAVESRLVTSS